MTIAGFLPLENCKSRQQIIRKTCHNYRNRNLSRKDDFLSEINGILNYCFIISFTRARIICETDHQSCITYNELEKFIAQDNQRNRSTKISRRNPLKTTLTIWTSNANENTTRSLAEEKIPDIKTRSRPDSRNKEPRLWHCRAAFKKQATKKK